MIVSQKKEPPEKLPVKLKEKLKKLKRLPRRKKLKKLEKLPKPLRELEF